MIDNASKTVTTKAKDRMSNIADKMYDLRVKKNKVEAKIAKLSK